MEDIREFVQTIASAIAETTYCNVTITDQKNVRIAGTGPYAEDIGKPIPEGSAFREVFHKKETIVIENPRESEICTQCDGRENCVEYYEIATPILSEDEVVGIIGIFANDAEQKRFIEARREAFCAYVENMARLLASFILVQSLLRDNRMKARELEFILESTDHAVLYFEADGRIKHMNHHAMRLFGLSGPKEDYLGTQVSETIGACSFFRRALRTDEELVDVTDIVEKPSGEIVTISATAIRMEEGGNRSTLVTARDAKTIQRAAVRARESINDTTFTSLIGTSEEMKRAIDRAKRAASYDSTILITGESGTGKELFARAIHAESPRSEGPFIGINCSAIPETLLESELFGYEPGAFTGASAKGKMGKMELANHGTLFLDEIGDMPLFLQAKLLRVLQDGQIMKIGGTRSVKLDLRIIAATNKNLDAMIDSGEFREDLYYRLNVIPLPLPSLAQRREDIPEIARHFLRYFNEKFGKNIRSFSPEALDLLAAHPWKGNVRELENVVEYLVSFAEGDTIEAKDVAMRIRARRSIDAVSLDTLVREYEKKIIREHVARHGSGKRAKEQAAEELGISLATLYRKLESISQK